MATRAGALLRGVLTSTLLAADAGAAAMSERGVWPALGGRPDPTLMARSPRFRDGAFHNVHQPRWRPPADDARATMREFLRDTDLRKPALPIPLVPARNPDLAAGGLHITWYGHASSLVEIDGARVLFDPVWSDRASPSARVGPRRLHPVPHRLDELPPLDAVVISHDHYDHLDMRTVGALAQAHHVPFVAPLGVGAHLRRWGVPEDRVIELDWDEHAEVAGLRLTAGPAQHFSGRALARNNTLWASWIVAGPTRKVFFTGDSGYFDGYARVGAEHGPFDATLIQVGAFNASWPDIHMTPEEGVAAHRDVRGGLLIPVHWATFNLAPHPWAEPADRAWAEAKAHDLALAVPRPGERIDVDQPPAVDGWWQVVAAG